jgi:hypothetical protein
MKPKYIRLMALCFNRSKRKLLITTISFYFIFIAGCSQDDSNSKDFSPPKGFGYTEGPPEGTPFSLPEGVTLAKEIVGYSHIFPDSCGGVSWEKQKGEGLMVILCLQLFNSTNKPINFEFPPGLIFESETTDFQHGILIEKASIEIPAQQIYVSPLGLMCMNQGKNGSGVGVPYKMGPVTDWQLMLDFFKTLEKKKLRSGVEPDRNIAAIIQTCVWNIIRKGYVSDYVKGELDKIPNK